MDNFVLITGASSGIGKAFAFEYAAQRKNLLLVARRSAFLEQIKLEITIRHNVTVEIIVSDITDHKHIDSIIRYIREKKYHIEILINNAGICYEGETALLDEDKITNILDLNIKAVVMLCRKIIPFMKEQKRGSILNISSMAAFQPGPYYALYFASKAFILNFTEALYAECKPYNIKVCALCPGFVETDMISNLPDMGIKPEKPEKIASLGIKCLEKGKVVRVNGVINNVLVFLAKYMPRTIVRNLTNHLIRLKTNDQHIPN